MPNAPGQRPITQTSIPRRPSPPQTTERRPQTTDVAVLSSERFNDMLGIDKHALDDEERDHPQKVFRVAEALELAISRRDAAAQVVKRKEAEIATHLRAEAARTQKKITDNAVDELVRTSPAYIKTVEAHLKAKAECGILEARMEAIRARGYALRDMTQLHLAKYFNTTGATNPQHYMRDAHANAARTRFQD